MYSGGIFWLKFKVQMGEIWSGISAKSHSRNALIQKVFEIQHVADQTSCPLYLEGRDDALWCRLSQQIGRV